MKTSNELRIILDALPRPLHVTGYVQIIGSQKEYYTVGVWHDLDEALFMLQYVQEEKAKCMSP